MAKKTTKDQQTPDKSAVLSPPLTKAEFENFLCTVTRSIKKQPEPEKPRT